MHDNPKRNEQLLLTPVDAQVYQEVRETERQLLDTATLNFLAPLTAEQRSDLSILDKIRRAAEIDIPHSATIDGGIRTTHTDYTFFQQHLGETGLWVQLQHRLLSHGVNPYKIGNNHHLVHNFLFGHILRSFPEESRNLYKKLDRSRSSIHTNFLWLQLRPGRERNAYLKGREAMRETMHLREDCVAHMCTPVGELITQLEQSEAGEDI